MEFEEFKITDNSQQTSTFAAFKTQADQSTHSLSSSSEGCFIQDSNAQYSPNLKTERIYSPQSQRAQENKEEAVLNDASGIAYLQQACFYLDPQLEDIQTKMAQNQNTGRNKMIGKQIMIQNAGSYQQYSGDHLQMQTSSSSSSNTGKNTFDNSGQQSLHFTVVSNKQKDPYSSSTESMEEEEDQECNKQCMPSDLTLAVKQKEVSYKMINMVRFQQHDLFELFCDVPFSLNYYLQEIEGTVLPQRNCIYNLFKKVVEVRSFHNGMMIDTSLSSIYSATNKFEFLVRILESKGHNQLYQLAKSIRVFQDKVNSISGEANNVTNQIKMAESKKLFYYGNESEQESCCCNIYSHKCLCNSNQKNNEGGVQSDIELESDFSSSSDNLDSRNIDLKFMQERQKASMKVKENILNALNPLDNYYFKTYTIDWFNQGNLKLEGYGFSQGYCELMGLTIAEYKQIILRRGFMENLNYDCKVKFMFPFFTMMPWSVKERSKSKSNQMIFTTFDNIVFKGTTIVEIHNLSYEFDKKHNFETDLCNSLLFVKVEAEQQDIENLFAARRLRGRRSALDDKDDEECDFYYSQDSQSFLERYYKDIYGPKYADKKQLRRCEFIEISQYNHNNNVLKNINPFTNEKLKI